MNDLLDDLTASVRAVLESRFLYWSGDRREHWYECRYCGWLGPVMSNRQAALETTYSHALDCHEKANP